MTESAAHNSVRHSGFLIGRADTINGAARRDLR